MKFRCIIIRGLPGSGKTTLAKKIHNIDYRYVICEDDKFFEHLVRKYGHRKYNSVAYARAAAWNFLRFMTAVHNGSPVILSNPSIEYWQYENYIELALYHDYDVVTLEPRGVFKSDKDTPPHIIESMRKKWTSSPVNAIQGLRACEEWIEKNITPSAAPSKQIWSAIEEREMKSKPKI